MATKQVKMTKISRNIVTFKIRGISPLMHHAWSRKAIEMMKQKHAGKKTKAREVRNPEAEVEEAKYYTSSGETAMPAMAFKSALISAAHKDLGIEKTLCRKSIFIHVEDPDGNIPIEFEEELHRQDMVRVGVGSADLRYRPEYRGWSAVLSLEIDAGMLTLDDLRGLVDRAGFSVGIGEWRPEKGGEHGRFQVDTDFDWQVCEV